MKKTILLLTLGILLTGCFKQPTLLSDDLRNIIPYQEGQVITFVSDKGVENRLTISKVEDGRFPDGLGAPLNEHYVVNAYRQSKTIRDGADVRILTLMAGYDDKEEHISFELTLRDAGMYNHHIDFSEFQTIEPKVLTTNFGTYNDAIEITTIPKVHQNDTDIAKFYWSLTKGYVQLIQYDGTAWNLKSIENR